MPFNIGAPELIIILVIALLVIGPGKLPDVGQALGKSIREFRKASGDLQDSVRIDASPLPPQAASAQPVPNVAVDSAAPNTLSQPAARTEPPDAAQQ